MYRYRKMTGVSRDVLAKFLKHRWKLGEITRIIGKRYRSRFWNNEAVMVYGTKGTARFDGCCWGYGGEGPHAVHDLLLACEVPEPEASNLAFTSHRGNQLGIDWEYNSDIRSGWTPC